MFWNRADRTVRVEPISCVGSRLETSSHPCYKNLDESCNIRQGGVYLPKEAEPGFARAPTNNAKQSCGGAWVVDAYASLGAHYGDFGATLRRLRLGGVLSLQLGTNPLFSDPLKGSVPDAGFREPELPRRRLARHHPGPELHRLWGLAWAHAYLGVLASALEDAAAGRFAVDRALPPAMRGCDPKICDSLPRCHTSMEPHSAHSLEQLVTHGLQKGDAGGRGWGRSPQYEGAQRAVYFGYIDRKIALVGGSDDGALTFRLDVREHGRPLVACQRVTSASENHSLNIRGNISK